MRDMYFHGHELYMVSDATYKECFDYDEPKEEPNKTWIHVDTAECIYVYWMSGAWQWYKIS